MSLKTKVLVVDDEPHIRRLFRTALDRGGHEVAEAGTAREALRLLAAERPDVVLLDLGLPDRDGLELVPLIRKSSEARVIIVSARDETAEKVAALDLGADDFVGKPVDTDELLARVRVVLRRGMGAGGAPLYVGAVEIDLVARAVRRGGVDVHLPRKEYGLLAELAKRPGRIVTHAELLRVVWGSAHETDVEYLRVAVRGIRSKLEVEPSTPTLIVNEPGVGYRLMSVRPANTLNSE